MIKANGLCKKFRRIQNAENEKKKIINKNVEFYAVDHVDIEAGKGEIVGILGPNGAGKTTLLRMLGCLMEPTEGEIIITDDYDNIINDTSNKKRRIGYLSGNTKLYHRFSIREMLKMMGEIYGLPNDVIKERIDNICEILKLDEFIDNRIERLSTGQTQRANISRCLIHMPDIYIFDEPTLGLDIISSQSIIEFMKSEKEKGKTILYSTHYMEEAQYLCDRIVMMNHGRITATGTPSSLMADTGTNNLRDAFLAFAEDLASDNEVKGDEDEQ